MYLIACYWVYHAGTVATAAPTIPVTEAMPPIQTGEAAPHEPVGRAGVFRPPSQALKVPLPGYWALVGAVAAAVAGESVGIHQPS
jgi:hypothetical protein